MKILADENVPRDVVAWLRMRGDDVLFAGEVNAGSTDNQWATVSLREHRVILTSDKDFGELIFRDGLGSHGIVLLRLDDLNVAKILERIQNAWSVVEANPLGHFIVITESKVRVRKLPPQALLRKLE